MPNRDVYSNRNATIRDFSGGWNVSDNDHNLASKFQPLSNNIVVGPDGALSVRQGYKYFTSVRNGVSTAITSQSVTFTTVLSSNRLKINWTAHGLLDGSHIRFDSLSAGIPGVGALSGLYGIRVIDANSFDIVLRGAASVAGTTGAITISGAKDTHSLAGNIIDATFFQGYWIVFDDIGEIAAVDPNSGVVLKIWSNFISWYYTGTPTGWSKDVGEVGLPYVSFDSFKQTMVVVNGRGRDKPLEISFSRSSSKGNWATGTAYVLYDTVVDASTGLTWRCSAAHTSGTFATDVAANKWVPHLCFYLLDPSNGSNANIPRAEFVQSFDGYVLLYGTDNGTKSTPTTVDISAVGTSVVYQGATSPGDSVQIELGRVTNTMDPRITGVANIRNFIYVAFYDTAMLGRVGIYSGTGATAVHQPDFTDQIPQHGAINHRVIQTVGNDLFMCDYAGVPGFSQSQQTGVIVPDRISQLVDPALNKHLSRLSAYTLRYKCWSVFNVKDRQYMLWLPKHDTASQFKGAAVPFYTAADLAANKQVLVNAPGHTVDAGDFVVVSGATSITGLAATDINGTRKVVGVIDANNFIMEVNAVPSPANQAGGGASVNFAPVNDETIGYIFCYNPQLRIRRWTCFRGMNFDAGAVSVEGKVLLCNAASGKLYLMGTGDKPIAADAVGDPAGTLTTQGNPINWIAETPWSDFGDRSAVKVNQQVMFDTEGAGQFNFSVFTDNIYQDPVTLALRPSASSLFTQPSSKGTLTGGSTGGFGSGENTFGGGRRTREQFNYHFPFRCKIAKMRFEGSSTDAFKLIAVVLTYMKGSSYR